MTHYKPGMEAPASGIYEASHGAFHRLNHQVTIAEGVRFPKCHKCGSAVSFVLIRAVRNAQQGYAPFGVIFEPVQIPEARKSRLQLVIG